MIVYVVYAMSYNADGTLSRQRSDGTDMLFCALLYLRWNQEAGYEVNGIMPVTV